MHWIGLLLCMFLASVVHADDMMIIGVGSSQPGTAQFDPSNTGTSLALSNGNLTITSTNSGVPGDSLARSIRWHSGGKYYYEFGPLTTNNGNPGSSVTGIMVAGVPLSG